LFCSYFEIQPFTFVIYKKNIYIVHGFSASKKLPGYKNASST